jgi:hypothetical protein
MFEAAMRRLLRLGSGTRSAVAVNVGQRQTYTKAVSVMSEKEREEQHLEELDDEELERQDGEPLPDRTQMSVMHPGPPPHLIGPLDEI